MADNEEHKIDCPEHGTQCETLVCQHIVDTLRTGEAHGFRWANDPGNPRPDAWCSACEAKVQATGGDWTEESETFAGVTTVCACCYDRARQLNLEAIEATEEPGDQQGDEPGYARLGLQ